MIPYVKVRELVDWLLITLVLGAGMIVFSQGISFLRWRPGAEPASLIDKHALALAALGVGVFCVGLLVVRWQARLSRVERRLPDRESNQG